MNIDEHLRELIEAEKAAPVPSGTGVESWRRLASAVISGAPALSVPLSTIPLTTGSMIVEGAVVAVVVGAIGTTAIVATAPTHLFVSATPAVTITSAVDTSHVVAKVPLSRELPTAAGSVLKGPVRVAAPRPARALPGAVVSEPSTPAQPASTLDEELLLIVQAKRQVDGGQPHLAQVWLDEHRTRFPAGMLSVERDGLEVLMACSTSDLAAAQAKAQTYASRYPGSPTLDRIRRACFRDSASNIPK